MSLIFYINGIYIGSDTTNNEGIAYFTYCCNKAGQFIVNATFNGDETYAESSISSLLTINKSDTKLIISGPSKVNSNTTVRYIIKLIDDTNQPITYQKISIEIDGIKYLITTDENGIAIIEHEFINDGEKIIFASYDGNDDYGNSLDEFVTNVKSAEVKPTAKNFTKPNMPKYSGQVKKTENSENNETKIAKKS